MFRADTLVAMNTSGDRFKALLRECNLTPSDFAAQRGITPQHVNNWFKRGLPVSRLDELAELFCVHRRWLQTGEGPKYPDPLLAGRPLAVSGSAAPAPLLDLALPGIAAPYCELQDGILAPVPGLLQSIPLQVLQSLNIPVLHCCCISMPGANLAPQLPQGALLAIDRSFTQVHAGEYYAVRHNDQLRVHQLSRGRNGTLCLHSHDRMNHPVERYTLAQRRAQRIEVLGWVFWWSCLRPARPAG